MPAINGGPAAPPSIRPAGSTAGRIGEPRPGGDLRIDMAVDDQLARLFRRDIDNYIINTIAPATLFN